MSEKEFGIRFKVLFYFFHTLVSIVYFCYFINGIGCGLVQIWSLQQY